ncbi:hypothetical protein CRG98_027978, partial [Punica granatum]
GHSRRRTGRPTDFTKAALAYASSPFTPLPPSRCSSLKDWLLPSVALIHRSSPITLWPLQLPVMQCQPTVVLSVLTASVSSSSPAETSNERVDAPLWPFSCLVVYIKPMILT